MKTPLQFLIDHGQNKISVLIDGKYELAKCRTPHQMDRMEEILQRQTKGKAEADLPKTETAEDDQAAPVVPTNPIQRLRRNWEEQLETCEVALNPDPGKMPWPKEVLREKLDPDQVQILASIWIERFFMPRIEVDPRLAPPRGQFEGR